LYGEPDVPHFSVTVQEDALDGVEPELIRTLTEAVVAVYGERARPLVVVELFGVPEGRWGVGGVPSKQVQPVIELAMREPALSLHGVPDPVGSLIAAITDATADVFGDEVRPRTTAIVTGIPTGRSGVGGQPV
jgi:phenylpyruvate tautomerase PptA (4-oxalocrotonate tautomerase family)